MFLDNQSLGKFVIFFGSLCFGALLFFTGECTMKMNERYHENLPALIEADQKNKERIAEVVPELYKECLEKREDTQYCEEEVKTVVAYLYYNEYY